MRRSNVRPPIRRPGPPVMRHRAGYRPSTARPTVATPDEVLNPDCPHRLCFLDLWFHRRTVSTRFVPEMLARRYRVECFYDDYALDKCPHGAQLLSFNKVVMFQLDPSALEHPDITWIPMWDEFFVFPKTPRGVRRVISFSDALHRAVVARGMASRSFRYWPELPTATERAAGAGTPAVFFWRRNKEVSWADVRRLVGHVPGVSFHVKDIPDPGQPSVDVPAEDMARLPITMHGWAATRREHEEILRRCGIFIAPRHREGIGMAFLEAMAHGLCVVAKDEPTANEYITHGANGILYRDATMPADMSRFREIGLAAAESAVRGRAEWLAREAEMLDFIAG